MLEFYLHINVSISRKIIIPQNITITETSFSSMLNQSCWRKPQIFIPFLHNKLFWWVRCDSDLLVYIDAALSITIYQNSKYEWPDAQLNPIHHMSIWPAILPDFLNTKNKWSEQSSVQLLLSPILSESSPDIICVFVLQRLFGSYFIAI